MRTILLAGGYGTRLRPLTNTIPKCLVPIKGKPLLEIWLERLNLAGFNPFLINTHYLSKQVETFIQHSPYHHQVTLIYEPQLLGTAGTLIANLDFFEGSDGLLIHADNYCLADLQAFKQAHKERPSNCLMTMMTFRTNNPSSCGIVEINPKGIVTTFHEKVESPPDNLANGAIYILSEKLLNILSNKYKNYQDFSTDILPHFINQIYT
ncbi:MAG: nucleotidyltransferase family protein, partial [Jaaginema sp. PMC 1078.18]|nr:nucleotidyltransferase family protein [Jaaginema sp. PMC 1078.18]